MKCPTADSPYPIGWPAPVGWPARRRTEPRGVQGRDRGGRPGTRRQRLGESHRQAVPARGDGRRRGAVRLRQRWLARHLPGQRQQLRSSGRRSEADQLPVPQQSRRHLQRRHAEGGTHPFRMGTGLLRRRLRQRRLRRSVRQLLGSKRPLPEQRQRHLHRRHRSGGRGRARASMGCGLLLSGLRSRRAPRSVRLELRELRASPGSASGRQRLLPLQRDRRALRSARLRRGDQPPLSQSR